MDQEVRPSRKPDPLQNEAMGDLSGLKGAHYHFVYSLYLLLNREAQEVAFYAGNDLRAHPPVELSQDGGAGILATDVIHDCWIQLKNTDIDQPWTPHRLLSDKTLFLTLILNALHSEHLQRSWSVRLVSPAPIRFKDIKNFLKAPLDKPELDRLFRGSIIDAYWRWNEWLQSEGVAVGVGIDHVRTVAFQALQQVASSEVMPISHISDRIQIALLQIFHEATAASQNALTLRGALMEVGNAAAAEPVAVSLGWLERKTNLSLRRQDLLGIDPVQASSAQVERHRPDKWDLTRCTPRQDLQTSLASFISSDRTLFVLTGDSGSGKSWASTYYAQHELHKSVRMLISGSLIPTASSLASLIADAFRDLARLGASNEEITRLVNGAASIQGPLVLIADDIPLTDNIDGFTHTLEKLCQEAQAISAKLVIVARRGVWQRLASQRHLAPFLFRQSSDFNTKPYQSYELRTVTDSEIRDVLVRRLPTAAMANRLALKLRAPKFAPLRNFYLLSVYVSNLLVALHQGRSQPIEQQSLGNSDIDLLLDDEIDRRLQEVAWRSRCDRSEIAPVQEVLVTRLWQERRTGSRPAALVRLIEEALPGLGRQALTALQTADVLTSADDLRTPSGTVTYANPQFGDRLTALWLAQQMSDDGKILVGLEPGVDDGVVTALVRSAINGRDVDALTWTQGLLSQNAGWLSALALGLAQRHEGNWRILATLTAWANRKEPYAAANAMRALGGMAAWSSSARAWVAALYNDEKSSQNFKGDIAMGAALDVIPTWARRCISLRLRREVRRDTDFPSDGERRAKFIKHALEPLKYATNAASATAAQLLLTRFIAKYRPSSPFGNRDVREQFDAEIDIIQGQITLNKSDADLSPLLNDLNADDWKVRIRAARALLPIAHDRPEWIKRSLFSQAQREQEILASLLQPLIYYTESDPDELLDIIQATHAIEQLGCGIALVLLGRIAWTRPERVRQILPDNLGVQIGPDFRAVLSCELALTWWQYASRVPADGHAREVLEALSVPDYAGLQDTYQVFAAFGAAVAIMARMDPDIAGLSQTVRDEDMFFHDLAMQIGVDALYTNFRLLLERHASDIAKHPLASVLVERLAEAITQYKAHEMHPIDSPYCEWQFRIAVVSSDFLAALAVYLPDVLSFVTKLPQDWPVLKVCNVVLEAGMISDTVIELGCEICAKHANVWGNISRDRDRFIQGLRVRDRLPQDYAYLSAGSPSHWSDSQITRIDTDITASPETILDTLHSHVTPVNAISFLWEWSTEALNWRAVLLGHVFRAAFQETPLGNSGCVDLCNQMLEAVEALPASPLKDEYLLTYSTLLSFLENKTIAIPDVEPGGNFLSQSHHAAFAILRSLQQESAFDVEKLEAFLANHLGWTEDNAHWIFEGTVRSGNSNLVSAYFPPALRIAMTVASLRAGTPDVFVEWLTEQKAIKHTLSNGACERVLRYGQYLGVEQQNEALPSALLEVESLRERFPNNGYVSHTLGHLLLLAYRFEEARDVLEQCLLQPSHRPDILTGAHYNLACALARLGDEDGSRRELTAALADNMTLRDLPQWTREQVENDPDFASIRTSAWFQEAVTTLPQSLNA